MTEKRYVLTESELQRLIDFSDRGDGESILDYDELTGETSDGYHTFNELYEHRNLLFLNWMQTLQRLHFMDQDKESVHPWWSRKHSDGSTIEGYIICGVYVSYNDMQITYHLPDCFIGSICKLGIRELDTAPSWDGHTSADVLDRLRDNL